MQSPHRSQSLQRYRSCVLDPSLVLSPHGVAIAASLSSELNVWIARELWHIIDNIELYLHKPELILAETAVVTEQSSLVKLRYALKQWANLRNRHDLNHLNLFWLGDSLKESYLPLNQDNSIFQQWEWLASFLDRQINCSSAPKSILTLAFRDSIAMTASISSTFLLTAQFPDTSDTAVKPPEICQTIADWGISCQLVPSSECFLLVEKEHIRQLLTTAGLAKFVWMGISFVVLHAVLPVFSNVYFLPTTSVFQRSQKDFTKAEIAHQAAYQSNLWEQSTCFWYPL